MRKLFIGLLLGSFACGSSTPLPTVERPKALPPPASFPGVQALSFSDESVKAILNSLRCSNPEEKFYCDALKRFALAKPLPAATSGVWAGSVLWAFAGPDGRESEAGLGIHHLYLRDGRGSFNAVTPSNFQEREQLKVARAQIAAGKTPSADSPIIQYLQTLTPRATSPLKETPAGLSFEMGLAAGSDDENALPVLGTPATVFVRENAEELLVVEVWGDGYYVKIGVFPKG